MPNVKSMSNASMSNAESPHPNPLPLNGRGNKSPVGAADPSPIQWEKVARFAPDEGFPNPAPLFPNTEPAFSRATAGLPDTATDFLKGTISNPLRKKLKPTGTL
jgi:hypothetical protein